MRARAAVRRWGVTAGLAGLLGGCVTPAYVPPGPIQLQPYPPPVSYRTVPDYRPPTTAPIPLQPAPLVEPLPPPAPAPTVTEVPPDDTGPIPVQDMPTPATDSATPPADAAATPAAPAPPAPAVQKTPVAGPGSNVPLEGFRPMRGQTRPAP